MNSMAKISTPTLLRPLFLGGLLCIVVGCQDSSPGLAKPEPPVSPKPVVEPIKEETPIPKKSYPRTKPEVFPGESAALLHHWFKQTKGKKAQESFGDLVARIAQTQVSKSYYDAPQSDKEEVLSIPLDTFQCVSLVETSLAMAQCTWQDTQNADCFADEVQQSRYRDGEIDGYGSRLHYFFDWLSNNADRGRLSPLTKSLGGKPFARKNKSKLFSIMTDRPGRYPALLNPQTFSHIEMVEESLNKRTVYVLRGPQIAKATDKFNNGDVVAVVTMKRGLLISHTGIILRTPDGLARFLHASSFHNRVIVTETDIADYIARDPKRIGILIYRPVVQNELN